MSIDLGQTHWLMSGHGNASLNRNRVATDLTNATWHRSTHSGNGGNCVEVATSLIGATWHTSTRSNNGGQCVEVSGNLVGIVAVRDSKNPAGPALTVHPAGWMAFTRSVVTDDLRP